MAGCAAQPDGGNGSLLLILYGFYYHAGSLLYLFSVRLLFGAALVAAPVSLAQQWTLSTALFPWLCVVVAAPMAPMFCVAGWLCFRPFARDPPGCCKLTTSTTRRMLVLTFHQHSCLCHRQRFVWGQRMTTTRAALMCAARAPSAGPPVHCITCLSSHHLPVLLRGPLLWKLCAWVSYCGLAWHGFACVPWGVRSGLLGGVVCPFAPCLWDPMSSTPGEGGGADLSCGQANIIYVVLSSLFFRQELCW